MQLKKLNDKAIEQLIRSRSRSKALRNAIFSLMICAQLMKCNPSRSAWKSRACWAREARTTRSRRRPAPARLRSPRQALLNYGNDGYKMALIVSIANVEPGPEAAFRSYGQERRMEETLRHGGETIYG